MPNVLRRNVRAVILCLILLSGVGLIPIGIILRVQLSAIPFIQPVQRLAKHPDAVLILGAGIEDSGVPSDALADRLLVGERVSRYLEAPMLLTGDGGAFRKPEIPAMHKWLLERGAAPDRFILDYEGFRTYESCRRAAEVYRLKRIVLITQRFHLGRAIYLCRSFGLETYGVPANIRFYKKDAWFITRDLLASVKAWFDVNIAPPQPPVNRNK
jgi:vancomycin permeability regulator SanA